MFKKLSGLIIYGLLGLGVFGLCVAVQAQRKPDAKNSPRNKIAALPVIPVLESVAQEIIEVEDLNTQVDLAGQVAELLGKSRPAVTQATLDKLFERVLREMAQDKSAASQLTALARKIIHAASGFDNKLTQTYIDKLATQQESTANENSATKNTVTETARLYLKLAREVIDNNPQLALSLAQKSFAAQVFPETPLLIAAARRQDEQLAETLFTAALQNIQARRGTDINELLLLYGYLFAPTRIPLLVNGRLGAYNFTLETQPVNRNQAVQFLQTTTQILSDPNRYTVNLQRLTHEPAGDLYLLKVLKFPATTWQPALLEQLNAQETFLAGFIAADQRKAIDATVERLGRATDAQSGTGQESPTDFSARLEQMLDEAEKTADEARRDQKYFNAASDAIRLQGLYEKALEIAGRMSEKTREAAKNALRFHIAEDLARKNQPAEAEKWAQKISDKVSQAYLFNVIAAACLTAKDQAKAGALLQAAEQNTRTLEAGQEKVSTLTGIAAVYARFDQVRAAELLREAVKEANRIETFTGQTAIYRSLIISDFGFFYEMYAKELSFNELICQQGKHNFEATLTDLRGLAKRPPRLYATLMLCRSVIATEKSKAKPTD